MPETANCVLTDQQAGQINRQMASLICSDRQTDRHMTDRQTGKCESQGLFRAERLAGRRTISYQLHSNNAASRHEVGELVIERLALVDSVELLCLPKRQLAHLHFAAGALTTC